jgi:hypothetical protein
MGESECYANNPDTRWICWQCGDLDQLNVDGLCAECKPELVAEFYQVCVRVVAGEVRQVERIWVIG